jgi:Fe-S-cluster containining protein
MGRPGAPLDWIPPDGLRFGCTRCGACCRRPGVVFLSWQEAQAIAAHLSNGLRPAEDFLGILWQDEGDGSLAIDVPDGEACPLLGPEGCTVQPVKPAQCAAYPFWPEIVSRRGAWKYEAKRCEGIGPQGEPYTPEQIRRIAWHRGATRTGDPGLQDRDPGAQAGAGIHPPGAGEEEQE